MLPVFHGSLFTFFSLAFLIAHIHYCIADTTGKSLSGGLAGTLLGEGFTAGGSTEVGDNLIPTNADPSLSITCVGDSYAYNLPVSAGFDTSHITMQQLCAKTQFNGGQPGQHIGGWCDYTRYRPQVVFDLTAPAQVNSVLANPRVMTACQYRCFCNYGLGADSIQPPAPVALEATWRSDQTYEMTVEVVNDFNGPAWANNVIAAQFGTPQSDGLEVDVPLSSHKGKKGALPVRVAEVLTMSQQVYQRDKSTLAHATFMSMNEDNQIECSGVRPPWPLPFPFIMGQFPDLTSLCAVEFSGGSSRANAGGYCHRTDLPGGDVLRTVWFSDEMTPRYEWTWGGPNFFASAAIRTWCRMRCSCKKESSKKDPWKQIFGSTVWNIIASQNIASNPDGSMTIQGTDSQQSETQVLPAQPAARLNINAAGTCGRDGRQFCPSTWPTEILGDIKQMLTPPKATEIIAPPASPPTDKFTTCGRYCSSQSDCGPGDSQKDCFCGLPSPKDAHTLGLDPISPVSVCLVLALTVAGISGRDVPAIDVDTSAQGYAQDSHYLDERGQAYQCPCNSTYISSSCCGVKDGRVWLD